MAKRKVIKFVYQGHRAIKPGEFYPWNNGFCEWFNVCDSGHFDVYHRIETEEEIPRWRAEYNQRYYFVTHDLKVQNTIDLRIDFDNMMYICRNYFQTKEQAQEYLDHCKTFFENN